MLVLSRRPGEALLSELPTGELVEVTVLAVDGGHMYWTRGGNGQGQLQCANLDGSAVTLLVDGLPGPGDIALDVSAGFMYWTDFSERKCPTRKSGWFGKNRLDSGLGSLGNCAR